MKYFRETVLFSANMLLLKACKGKNVSVGSNLHVISPFAFRAEMPDAGIGVGDDVIVWDRTKIHAWGKGQLTIGHSSSFGSDTIIHCRERIEIGNYALISWNVMIADFDAHSISLNDRIAEIEHTKTVLLPNFSKKRAISRPPFVPRIITRPIIIEDGVWIGANAIILKGSKIGRGSIIGAGAVVSGEIPPMSIAVGNPARVVKEIKES